MTRYAPVAALACVLALGGEALASHVHCGDVITTDTTLDSDLVGCPDIGIVVGAYGITLDLGGHTISGAPGDAGVLITGVTGVTVRNGRITGFSNGIFLSSTSFNTLGGAGVIPDATQLEVFGNTTGIYATGASRNTIGSVFVHENGPTGAGIHLDSDSARNRLVANRVTGNSLVGILIVRSDGNFMLSNFVAENGRPLVPGAPSGGSGIMLHNAPASQLFDNTVHDNGQHGVQVFESDRTFVVGTTATRNGESGVHVERSERVQLISNDLLVSGQFGVVLVNVHRSRLFRNTANGNVRAGVLVEHGKHNVLLENEARNNESGFVLFGDVDQGHRRIDRVHFSTEWNGLRRNVAVDNQFAGFSLHDVAHTVLVGNRAAGSPFGVLQGLGPSRGNRISGTDASENTVGIEVAGGVETWVVGNFADRNSEDGIRVRAAADRTRVEDNEASENGDDGIEVASPATTIRRNVANDNVATGIFAVAGVTDGGGNAAAGNGDPAQCVNVACD